MDDWKKQIDRWGVGGYGPAKDSVWGARSRLKRTLRAEPTEPEVHPIPDPWCADCEAPHDQCKPTEHKRIEGHPLSRRIK